MKNILLISIFILSGIYLFSSTRILNTPGTSDLHNSPYDQHIEYYFKEFDESILYIYDTDDGDGNFVLLRYGKDGEVITPYEIYKSDTYSEEIYDISIGDEYFYVLKETFKGLFKIQKFSFDGVLYEEEIYEKKDAPVMRDYSLPNIDIELASIRIENDLIFVDFVSLNSLGYGEYQLNIFRYEIDNDLEVIDRKILGFETLQYKPKFISFMGSADNFFLWTYKRDTKQIALFSRGEELGIEELYEFNYDLDLSSEDFLFRFSEYDGYTLAEFPSLLGHLGDVYFIPKILVIKENEITKTLSFNSIVSQSLVDYEETELNRSEERFWGSIFIEPKGKKIIFTSNLTDEFQIVKNNYRRDWGFSNIELIQLETMLSTSQVLNEDISIYKECPLILFEDSEDEDAYLFFGSDGYYYDHHSSFLAFNRQIDWSGPEAAIYGIALSPYSKIEVPYDDKNPEIYFEGKITNFGDATVTGQSISFEQPELASVILNDIDKNELKPGETITFSGRFSPTSIWSEDSKVEFLLSSNNDSFFSNNKTSALFRVEEIPESIFSYVKIYDTSWEEYSSFKKPYPLLEEEITVLGKNYIDKTKAGFLLEEGSYNFTINPENYDSVNVDFSVIRNENDPYELHVEGLQDSYSIKSCGNIDFHVQTSAGTPIKYADIDISSIASGRTNNDGEKTFENVKSGKQIVTVSKKYYKSKYIEVDIPYNSSISETIILKEVPKGIATIHIETDSWPVNLEIYDNDGNYFYSENVDNPMVNVELFDGSYKVRASKEEEQSIKSIRVYGGENSNVTLDVKKSVPYSEKSKKLRSKTELIIPAALHGYTPPPGEQFDVSIMIGLFELKVELYGKENDNDEISEINMIKVNIESGPQYVDSVSAMWSPINLEDIGGLYSPSGVPDWVGKQGSQIGQAFDAIPFIKMPEIELKASYGSGLTKTILKGIKIVSGESEFYQSLHIIQNDKDFSVEIPISDPIEISDEKIFVYFQFYVGKGPMDLAIQPDPIPLFNFMWNGVSASGLDNFSVLWSINTNYTPARKTLNLGFIEASLSSDLSFDVDFGLSVPWPIYESTSANETKMYILGKTNLDFIQSAGYPW